MINFEALVKTLMFLLILAHRLRSLSEYRPAKMVEDTDSYVCEIKTNAE